jgi:endoglucanase
MFKIISLLICVVVVFGCKDKTPELIPEIQLSTASLTLDEDINTAVFHVKSNTSWTGTSSQNWCKLNPASGSEGTTKVEVTLEPNPTSQSREALITISSGSISQQLKVIQARANTLNPDKSLVELAAEGGEVNINIDASGQYSFATDKFWVETSQSDIKLLKIKVNENPTQFSRSGKITLKLLNLEKTIEIKQAGKKMNIPADKNGMGSDAHALAKKMKLGWNLGNSLEACSNEFSASEILWGNPKTTKDLITFIKQSGFNAVRIPTAWSGYIEDRATHKIKDEWIMRVREVVDYCVENDMYTIINIHWDGGWLENNPVYSKQKDVNAKQKALWEQIAVAFRDYDEHLLFAGTNEVHADYNRPTKEHLEVQMSFNQTFVDAVRSTGGKNAWRTLIAQGYNTNITYTNESLILPKDPTLNRMMAEVHYYDPYDFTLDETASGKYLWGKEFAGNPNSSNWGQEAWLEKEFDLMQKKFVSKGVPVILGEYAATYRGNLTGSALQNHKKARYNYIYEVTKSAKENGLIPFYWDNGGTGANASGIFDRNTRTVAHPDLLDALVKGAN